MEPLPQTRVYIDPNRVALELKRHFGIALEEIEAVGRAVYRGFAQIGSLHPKGFNGTNAWAEGTERLRATMIPKGWHPEDPQGQPRVVSRDRKISLTVSSGNPDTGVPNRIPQTRNDKGSQTASSVRFNARQGQLFMFKTADDDPESARASQGGVLWIFLYYIDLDAREMRMELSQPTDMSDNDKINGWSVRYILPTLKFDLDFVAPYDEDDSPDIDFDVTPKIL